MTFKLSDCVDILDNQRVPINSDERSKQLGEVPYYGATGQVGWIDKYIFNEELVLLGEDGAPFLDKSKPIAYIINGKSWVNNHAHVLRGKAGVADNWFIKYFLDNFDFSDYVAGTTRLKLTQTLMRSIPVKLPSLNEQKEISAWLKEVIQQSNSNREKISNAKQLITQFRQSILFAAVTGKLTEDWREKNKNEKNETLSTIKLNLQNYNKGANVKKHKVEEFNEFEFDNSIEYPDSWELENLGNISELVTDGEHITPRRTPSGKLLLSARNIQNGYLSLEKVDYIPDDEYLRIIKRCNPQKDDVLISCSGSVGRVSLVPEGMEFTMVRSVALVKIQENKFLSKYLELYLQSPVAQNQIYKLQKATAQANLFIGQIKKIVVLLPPEKEIEEIVRRVKFNFELADKVEEQIANAEAKVSKLTQAVLAKTFSNEGVTI